MDELKEVSSHTISHVGYDATTETLTLRFRRGGLYRYAGVPAKEHEALLAAESMGKHFQARIRSQYQGAKVAEPQLAEAV